MNEMRFEQPKTAEAAAALLAGTLGLAKVLSGGTDLMVFMRSGNIKPELVLDVKSIPEMNMITFEDHGCRFGAAVSCMALLDNKKFAQMWPGVIDSANLIGPVQVRGRATFAGNLCTASPAADTVPAMIAAGAIANVVGPNGRREVPIENICTGPGKTSLEKGELIVSFFLPKRADHSGDAYLRFTPRTEMDIAVVSVGLSLSLDTDGVCTSARVSLGAVAERALLVPEAAAALIGTKVDETALANLAAAASAAARPIDDKRGTKVFRIKVAGVLARRAAVIALSRAKGNN